MFYLGKGFIDSNSNPMLSRSSLDIKADEDCIPQCDHGEEDIESWMVNNSLAAVKGNQDYDVHGLIPLCNMSLWLPKRSRHSLSEEACGPSYTL